MEEEPEWVEVMVDILLSLLSRPSRHIRQVCRTVFASICPNVTPAALAAILDVSERLSLSRTSMSIPQTYGGITSSRYTSAMGRYTFEAPIFCVGSGS